MFRLEKVFQNDDKGFILLTNVLKTLVIFCTIYVYSILEIRTIYQLFEFDIFIRSTYFEYGIFFPILFLIITSLPNKLFYKSSFMSFLKDDILSIFFSNILILTFFYILDVNLNTDKFLLYLIMFLLSILSVIKLYINHIYNSLIKKNIIQKNIMLVGKYHEIQKVLKEDFHKINIFKCCLMIDSKNDDRFSSSEFKMPIFNTNDDIRSILEYHALGQIWILNGEENDKKYIFNKIIQFSVDTLNLSLNKTLDLKEDKILGNKFHYEFYAKSRFFGINLFIKILLDKVLSILFMLLSSPIILISSILIFIEDGSPIMFTQYRTGWDGRRFKVYKLRSLYFNKYDPTTQVTENDKRKLRVGKFIRKFSIDEIPQLYNILKGEMSLVGPRPHPVTLDLNYSNIYKPFLTRYRCNPGLTGWAQINGLRGETKDPKLMKKRMDYDLWYLKNWTLYLDILIIIKTFYSVFRYKGD